MSALSTPLPDLGSGVWQYDFADLASAGVMIDPSQKELITSPRTERVIVAWPLPNPVFWDEPALLPGDQLRHDGVSFTVPVPAVTAWDEMEDVHFNYGPIWNRFPSVPVYLEIPDPLSYANRCKWGWPIADYGVTYARVWDVLPERWMGEETAMDFEGAFHTIWTYSDYAALRDLYWVINRAPSVDPCWLAEKYAVGSYEEHQHTPAFIAANPSEQLWECRNGNVIIEQMTSDYLQGPATPKRIRFEPPFNEAATVECWEYLKSISQPAAEQALLVAPPWDREELRATERKAGRPWD